MRRAFADAYGIVLATPLLHTEKREIARLALRLGVPIEKTWSCYAPTEQGTPCGECTACLAIENATKTKKE